MARREAESRERAHRERAYADPALHVVHARTGQPARRAANGHPRELSDRPDGVDVAEEQHLRVPCAPREAQVIARHGLVQHVGAPAEAGKLIGGKGSEAIDGGLVRAG